MRSRCDDPPLKDKPEQPCARYKLVNYAATKITHSNLRIRADLDSQPHSVQVVNSPNKRTVRQPSTSILVENLNQIDLRRGPGK